MLSTNFLTDNHHIVHLRYIRLIFHSLYFRIKPIGDLSTEIPGKGIVTWLERRKSIDGKLRPSGPKLLTESTMLFLGVDHPYLNQHNNIKKNLFKRDPNLRRYDQFVKMMRVQLGYQPSFQKFSLKIR